MRREPQHDGGRAVDAARVGTFEWETARGVLTWSSWHERLWGYQPGEFDGTYAAFARRVHPDDLPKLEAAISHSLAEHTAFRHDFRVIWPDGSVHWIWSSGETVGPTRVTGSVIEITASTQVARLVSTALAERERDLSRMSRLYAALSHINQATVRMAGRDELLHEICHALVEHGGFLMSWIGWCDPETLEIRPVASWVDTTGYLHAIKIYGDDRPEGHGPTGTAYREGRPYISNDLLADPASAPWRDQMQRRGFRASAVFPIREANQLRGTLSVYADEPGFFREPEIELLAEAAADTSFALDNLAREAAARAAEEAVRRERDFSAAVIRSFPGVLYVCDEQRRFLRWNDNFERVIGYSATDLARLHPLDLFMEAAREQVAAKIEEVFRSGEAAVDAGLRAKDGTVTPFHFTGVRAVLDGQPILIGVGIDITAHDRATRAEAADRLKSAFLATMSHELRTPLNSILGFTGIVQAGMAGPINPEQHKQLGMVRESARHLLALINDVLDLSKIEADQLEVSAVRFELREAIERVVASVGPLAAAKGLGLSVVIDPALAEVTSDRRRVEQILLNLLHNALKFTEHGVVTLAADLAPSRGSVPCARIRIIDTGIGIHEADLATLFQPFRQVDQGLARKHEGTGLGLVICRRLATLLGGAVTATSTWGRGSEFTFLLPLAKGMPA